MSRHSKNLTTTLEFTAKDFPHHDKNQFWYVGIGLLAAALLVLAVRFGEYLLGAVVVAAALAIVRTAHLAPGAKTIKLTAKGVTWGDRFYGYHQLRAFWLADRAGQTTLYLERLNLAPVISFVIPAAHSQETLTFLSRQLPYHRHKSLPLGDRLSHLLKI